MKRIDTATAGAGGVFTDGNVVTGVLPTVLDASWLNMVQDELHSPLDFLGIASDPNSDTQLLEAIQALAASYTVGGFPITGVAGAVFAKNSATNGDASWISPGLLPGAMPTGGTTDQVLRKVDGTDYNYAWTSVSALPNAIPTGGTTSQLLAKNSGTSYDVSWKNASALGALPTGGTTSQVLNKASGTDFDTAWTTLSSPSKYIVCNINHTSGTLSAGSPTSETITGYTDVSSSGITRSSGTFTLPAFARVLIHVDILFAGNITVGSGIMLHQPLVRVKNAAGTVVGQVQTAYIPNPPVPTSTQILNYGTQGFYFIDNSGSATTTTCTIEWYAVSGDPKYSGSGGTTGQHSFTGRLVMISQ